MLVVVMVLFVVVVMVVVVGGFVCPFNTIRFICPQALTKKINQDHLETLWQSASSLFWLSLASCSFGGAGDNIESFVYDE